MSGSAQNGEARLFYPSCPISPTSTLLPRPLPSAKANSSRSPARRSSCSSRTRRRATSRWRSQGLVEGIRDGLSFQTLLGVTGSGKTFTMANVIAQIGRPAIVFAPNKTLAAQLYCEFREFFPKNAVEYFVSYYDYYQPEAYVPQRDLFIEKDSAINEHIEQMRLSATKSVLERRDVVIVASVSAIYGIGEPEDYTEMRMIMRSGDKLGQRDAIAHLIRMQYTRNETDFSPRHLPRARRHDRRLPGRAQRAGGADRAVRRRARVAAPCSTR